MDRKDLIGVLPKGQYAPRVISDDQDVEEIMELIEYAHKRNGQHYDKICKRFWTGDVFTTCKALFNFCKNNIRYEIESGDYQTVCSPRRILERGYGDCKHYATFINGVLSALNRKGYGPIKNRYRFASYKLFDDTPTHVFAVVDTPDGEIWVDPVLPSFNDHQSYNSCIDLRVAGSAGRVGFIGGCGCNANQIGCPGSDCSCGKSDQVGALQVAPNGNMSGPTDPNFIHFPDEEKGLLLPNIPNYPRYLPSLQLGTDGRLKFWNMPKYFYRSFADDPAMKGTSNFFIAWNNVKNWSDPYQPMGADRIETNGQQNGHPAWFEAGAILNISADYALTRWRAYFSDNTHWVAQDAVTPGSVPVNWSKDVPVFLGVGPYPGGNNSKGQTPNLFQPPQLRLYNAEWVFENVQFYINRYLTVPYPVTWNPPNTDAWLFKFLKAVDRGDLQNFLSTIDFLEIPHDTKSILDTVESYIPIAAASLITLASGGAGSAALTAAVAALTKTVNYAALSDDMKKASDALNYQKTHGGVNPDQINNDVQVLQKPEEDFSIIKYLPWLAVAAAGIIYIND